METLIDKVMGFIKTIDWEGPEAFGVALIVIFTVLKKWIPLLLVFLTIIIGAKIDDYIVIDMVINGKTVGASFFVYVIGAVVIFFVSFLSIFNK